MDSNFTPITNEKAVLLVGQTAFKYSNLQESIFVYFSSPNRLNELCQSIQSSGLGKFPQNVDIFDTGISCEVLEPGSGDWVKGKVRLKFSLEFCPDAPPEPEVTESSPPNLDDIRQMNVE